MYECVKRGLYTAFGARGRTPAAAGGPTRPVPAEREGGYAVDLEALRAAKRRAVGTKQTLKAIQSGQARAVYVARDADPAVVRPILAALEKSATPVYDVETMKLLGRVCGIEVGAAAAALL